MRLRAREAVISTGDRVTSSVGSTPICWLVLSYCRRRPAALTVASSNSDTLGYIHPTQCYTRTTDCCSSFKGQGQRGTI